MIFLSLIKFLGNYFFIWSLPIITLLLNVVKQRELIEINVLIALGVGFIIHILWEFTYLVLKRKEYHKNFL